MTTRPSPPPSFIEWFGVDDAVLHRVLSEAMGRGAEFADLYFQHARNTNLILEDGKVSRASTGVNQGVGVRAVQGDQTGYAYSERLDLESMLEAARTAATIASGTARVPPQGLHHVPTHKFYDVSRAWDTVSITDRLPLLRQAEQKIRSLDPAVKKVRVNWSDGDEHILIATSEGTCHSDRRPMGVLRCSVTAEKNGERQSGSSAFARRDGIDGFSEQQIDDVCRKAVDRTMILFEARRPPAGEMPVLLAAGASGILLHEAIGHGLEADFNRKGTSIYASLMNQKVAPDFVTVVDDGTQDHDRGALNVDDEGNPTEKTVLIEDGVLRGYLHDRISAKHYGVKATGSGRRQSFRHVPIPRMRSTYMLDGPHSYDEMVSSVKKGIVAETFLNGQVQIGAGDYTFYIKNGWLIEDGKITAPIRDVNIIGNGPETLKNIVMAASDSELDAGGWVCGKGSQSVPVSMGIPSVLINQMTVGGVNA